MKCFVHVLRISFTVLELLFRRKHSSFSWTAKCFYFFIFNFTVFDIVAGRVMTSFSCAAFTLFVLSDHHCGISVVIFPEITRQSKLVGRVYLSWIFWLKVEPRLLSHEVITANVNYPALQQTGIISDKTHSTIKGPLFYSSLVCHLMCWSVRNYICGFRTKTPSKWSFTSSLSDLPLELQTTE